MVTDGAGCSVMAEDPEIWGCMGIGTRGCLYSKTLSRGTFSNWGRTTSILTSLAFSYFTEGYLSFSVSSLGQHGQNEQQSIIIIIIIIITINCLALVYEWVSVACAGGDRFYWFLGSV